MYLTAIKDRSLLPHDNLFTAIIIKKLKIYLNSVDSNQGKYAFLGHHHFELCKKVVDTIAIVGKTKSCLNFV